MLHGAELVDVEDLAADRDAALLEDDRAGAGEADGERNGEHDRGEEGHGGGGADEVQHAFAEAAEAGGGGLAITENRHAVELGDRHALGDVARRDVGDDANIDGELFESSQHARELGGVAGRKSDVDGVGLALGHEAFDVEQAAEDGAALAMLAPGVWKVADEVRDLDSGPGVAFEGSGGDLGDAPDADDGDVAEIPAAFAEDAKCGPKDDAFDCEAEGEEDGEEDDLEAARIEHDRAIAEVELDVRGSAREERGLGDVERGEDGQNGEGAGAEDLAGLADEGAVAAREIEAEEAEGQERDGHGGQ